MNILYYCDEYPPARNGGIGTVVKLVAEAMAKRGHRVFVAGTYWEVEGKETVEEINNVTIIRWHKGSYNTLGITVCDLINGGQRNKTTKTQRILNRTQGLLEDVIKKHQIDVLEMPDYVDVFIHYSGLIFPARRFSVPMIVRVHGSVSFLFHHVEGVENEGKTKQDKVIFDQADAICAVSEFSKRYVEENLCRNKSIDVIYNPIEASVFKSPKESEGQNILFFGKIAEMKGAFSLIKAFNIVAEKNLQARLRLVGSGDIEGARRLVNPQFADRVDFVGFVPHERIADEIDAALFCVLPSYFENFSMAALEVLARRKALIYTQMASGKELIDDGENGFLVDPNNVGQIAEKMELLLSDVGLRHRLAENGYEMCRSRFSTETIVPQMEQYYQSVIEKCRK
ncbi:MAG: glycosyltransferase family 4 protein [Bacteroidales bacterium]|nr:glycosyltransferase family 4 protein [Bacteroidales bacterium]